MPGLARKRRSFKNSGSFLVSAGGQRHGLPSGPLSVHEPYRSEFFVIFTRLLDV